MFTVSKLLTRSNVQRRTAVGVWRTNKKSNLHHIRGITPKSVTSCGAHLRGLVTGQRENVVAVAIQNAVDGSVRLTGSESNPSLPTPIAMSLTATPKTCQKPIRNEV